MTSKAYYPLTIAIVGRPNVGKSALFNRIVGKRIAVVDEQEGITRDRIYATIDWFGEKCHILDTGGICAPNIPFYSEVQRQVEVALEEADVIIMVVDGNVGVTLTDEKVVKKLHSLGKPLILAVNKIDDTFQENRIHDFYSLGVAKVVGISALHGHQVTELIDSAIENIARPLPQMYAVEVKSPQIAIIGRPNVGKSTLMNALLREERCVTSPIAGTTRDAIESSILFGKEEYLLIDTAGIKRKGAEREVAEKFAAIRTEQAIDRADICLVVLDARDGVTTQEKKILHMIEQKGKGCILFFNKWDLVTHVRMEHVERDLREAIPFLQDFPMLFGSATEKRNIETIASFLKKVYGEYTRRIPTAEYNTFLEKVWKKCPPPRIQGKRLKAYYATQVGTSPPYFVLFVNAPELCLPSYKKYLLNSMRKEFGFFGAPLFFKMRKRESKT